MAKVVECVPNFSEGQHEEVIAAISKAISETAGVALLDVDSGKSTNRTVYTFVGAPNDVIQGALNAALVASQLIDMRQHKGEHPRMGALDVCPFIPVSGVTIEECVDCAKKFGQLLANALNAPVFLYGSAAELDFRKTLPQIRSGEYEGLIHKLKCPEWKPDFGPSEFVPKWGATVTGVRKFLIAYNVNVLGTKEQAHRIALNLREQGRGPNEPGRLRHCQAIGWWLEEQNMAQISINLTDFEVTPIHQAYEEARKEAAKLKVAVTGSEIVGLVPLDAMLKAADYYIENENLFVLEEEQKIHLAINRLGLNSIGIFNPQERIIEYNLRKNVNQNRLADISVSSFVHQVAARTAAPGGGSVAALVASVGAALGSMAGLMTYGKRQWESLDANIREIIPPLHKAVGELMPLIDADTQAFNQYLEALRLPKSTSEQISERNASVERALRNTVDVPLSLARNIGNLWEPLRKLAEIGNLATKSDMQVSARCLLTGVWGAYYNVCINLNELTNGPDKRLILEEINKQVQMAETSCNEILNTLDKRAPCTAGMS